MKIKTSTVEVTFKPKTLTITFENEKEIKALTTLMGYDTTIPRYLKSEAGESLELTELLRTQMHNIYNELSELMEASN